VANVLFSHGHLLRFDAKQHAIGKPYPPLATLFAAAHVRALGHAVSLFDPMLDPDVSSFGRVLAQKTPDVVVLYDDSFNWFTKMCLSRMRQAATSMIALAREYRVPVIVAGHDAADDPEAYLRAGASFVIAGEGEITLGELLELFERRGGDIGAVADDAGSIAGLVYHHHSLLRRTAPRRLLQDLDILPLPAWDIADVDRYRSFWRERHGYFSLNVVTTRGCPYRCNWCAKPVYGSTYHTRSPEQVTSELQLLRDRYLPDHIWFCDDILGLKTRWLSEWSSRVVEANVATPFLCQTRADLMTEESARALAKAGAREVWLGAESGSQQILDAMDKDLTVEHVRTAVSRLRSHGVRVALFLQFGYTGEGWKEVQETRAMVRELLPDDIGVSVSYPLPGTRFHAELSARIGEKRNWAESSDLDPLVPGRFSKRFYQSLSRVVHAELRVMRGFRELGAWAREPLRMSRKRLRRIGELRHVAPWLIERVRLEAERRSFDARAVASSIS
jgi:anaerobic magnesium-protoporphyrin IX monomethyl ester cyclase